MKASPSFSEKPSTKRASSTRSPSETVSKPKKTGAPKVVAKIPPEDIDAQIRHEAYCLAERRGFESGKELEDWLAAERSVRTRLGLEAGPVATMQ
jgi:hypothetical protein